MADCRPGFAQIVGSLTVVISLMVGGGAGEVQLAVLIVRHQGDALAVRAVSGKWFIILIPLVGWSRVRISATFKHKSIKVSKLEYCLLV